LHGDDNRYLRPHDRDLHKKNCTYKYVIRASSGRLTIGKFLVSSDVQSDRRLFEIVDSVQEFLQSTVNDERRGSTKTPLAPATRGLKGLMHKLGSLNARHEALVRRVDELEVLTNCHELLVFRLLAF